MQRQTSAQAARGGSVANEPCSNVQRVWSAALLALAAGLLLGVACSDSPSGQEGARRHLLPDAGHLQTPVDAGQMAPSYQPQGITPELQMFVELTPASSRTRAVLQVSIDNRTSSSLRIAYVVQILDAQSADVVAPTAAEVAASAPNTHHQLMPLDVDLGAVNDGYYELVVQGLAAPDSSASADDWRRWVPAHVYVALDASGAREVDFLEWYARSGANQLVSITDQLGPVQDAAPPVTPAERVSDLLEQQLE